MSARRAIAAFAIAAAALAWASPLEEVELRALDLQFELLRDRAPAALPERVVVVGIDNRSVDAVNEPVVLWHGHFARFLEALEPSRPAIVAFDVVMPDRSFEGIAPGLDRELLRALLATRATFPTLLAITVKDDGKPRGIHPAFIAAAGTQPGYALWRMDTDGTIRRFEEALGENFETVATLVGEAARRLGKEPRAGYIDFAYGQPFAYEPFVDVLAASRRGDRKWLDERFAGKAVLLGMVLPYADSVRVPVRLAGWGPRLREAPGVLLHAQALRTLLADRMVTRAPAWVVAALALAACVAALAATTPVRAAAIAALLVGAFSAASIAALAKGWFVPVAWPLAAALAAIALHQGLDVAARLAERRRLRSSFAGSVSPAVMQQILDGRIVPQQGGVITEVCVLFSDIRGYTTLSEGKAPAQIVGLLNRYFDRMVAIIHDRGGTVVSFMGDGIMAVFGAPQPLANSAVAGFDAAVHMLEGVREFNREIEAEGLAPIAIGVGLHLGEALVGHIGSKTRHDYTAIGDVTNVASRLQSATKDAGYRIVVSREVVERLPDRSTLAALGLLAIKGHTPVESFGYERVVAVQAPAQRAESATVAAVHTLAVAGFVLAAALAAPAVVAQQSAGALALVSDVQGGVRMVREQETTHVRLLADLFAETRLELDPGARLVLLMLANGEQLTLRGAAQARLTAAGVSAVPANALSSRTSGVGGPSLRRKDLAQAAIVMRNLEPASSRRQLLSLAGTVALGPPLVFRWMAVEGAGPYRLTLLDENGRSIHSTTTTAIEYELPDAVVLSPGRRYTWEIATRKANGVEHSQFGDFAIATPALRAEAAARRPAPDAPFADRVAYAVWLDSRELADAAREEWKRLAGERPGEERLRRLAEQ